MKITLYCLRIDKNEIKTAEKEKLMNFVRRHRGNISSCELFSWDIPESKLERAMEYSFDELRKFRLERGKEYDFYKRQCAKLKKQQAMDRENAY